MRVFDERTKAEKYKPTRGDTLANIAATHPKCTANGVTWQELALFNWATVEPDEVNRALIEIVGCALDGVNGDPSATVMDPAFGPDGGDKEVLIPVVWTKPQLPLEKVHTLKVRQRKPMPAVRITELSPWFIPETEDCDLKYALEGIKERADKVGWSVWASKYQTAVMDAPSPSLSDLQKFTFTPCALPIRAELLTANLDPRTGEHAFLDKSNEAWKGESKASDGVLKPRPGKKRYLTVANSPYTVQFTFHKNSSDFKEDSAQTCPRIELESFWPYWRKPVGPQLSPVGPPPAPVLDPDSLKIKWKVEGSGGVLKLGQLIVWDKANDPDRPVFRKALGAGDLSDGDHEFNWADHGGEGVVQTDRMPYRAQIQAHTDMDTDPGLALAVMHTEVRLFAPPGLDTHDDPVDDTQCFDLELAPFTPDESVVAVNTTKWYQLQLAKIGLYPGPVNGERHPAYELAHVDFKRSFTKNAAAPFERMRAEFDEDGDFQTALARVANAVEAATGSPATPPAAGSSDRQRAMFGDATQLDNPGREDLTSTSDINARLCDPAQEMVVWIDGRHYYTSTVSPDTGVITNLPDGTFLPNPPSPGVRSKMGMENYHGELTSGDAIVDMDSLSVARPWIPVAAAPPLLSKSHELTQTAKPALTDAMRKAIGPVRMDWTFTETGEDLTRIDITRYNSNRLRTRLFVDEITKNLETDHEGKKAKNCPEAYGGIRPGAGSPPGAAAEDYYKKAVAFEDDSLAPWRAYDDTALRKICCLTHDDLGQDATKIYASLIGKAGAYLHLSRIAGDGYQFRARISFEEEAGAYLYPNHEVLRNRYQKLPQAHTCKLRNWRKSSFRAYVAWAPAPQQRWGAWRSPVMLDYRSAFIHFALEPNAINPLSMTALYPAGAQRTAFLDVLQNSSDALFHHGNDRDLHADYLWPWNNHPQFGAEYALPFGTSWGDFRSDVLNLTYFLFAPDMILDIIYRIEQNLGLLRGHVLVEFRGSQDSWVGQYTCTNCGTDQAVLQNVANAIGAAVTGCCGGTALDLLQEYDFDCTSCPHTDTEWHPSASPPGASNCPSCGGAGTWAPIAGPFDAIETGEPSLVNTAMGLALGGSILITLNNNEDWPWWTHEIGHNRHLQHAGGEGGFQVAQHDSTPNTHDGRISAQPPKKSQWDRVCTMTYQDSRLAGPFGDDRQQFCGKCVLKGRGWKVENLPDPGTLGTAVPGP